MRVAFIGLGTMGGPMAANLLSAGHPLVVHDLHPPAAEPLLARGARWADSPQAAAAQAELLLTSLPGPQQVEAVALGPQGLLAGAAPGTVWADLSTSSPSLIRRLAAVFAERGVAVLDAPVSGGPLGAQRGSLQLMVGGDEAVFERVRPVLLAVGDKLGYMGPIGAGSVAKLVHNMISYCASQALAEGLTLGIKAGVAPEKLLEAIRGGAYGQGYMLSHRLPQVVLKGAFEQPLFALALARKDVGLATELGREFQVPMTVANVVEQIMVEGLNRGWGREDSSAIFKIQEERAGVEVRGS